MTQPDSIKMSYLSPPYQRSNTRTSEETPIVYGQNSATEKSANVAVTEVGLEPRSPTAPLAYRRTDIIGQRRAPKQVLPMDRFLKTCAKQTPFVTGLIFTIITAIPFVVFLLVAVNVPRTTIGGEKSKATLAQLAKWLLVCWGGFIGLLWIGNILAAFFSWFCGLSARWVRYQRLAEAICLRFVLLLWAIVIWAIIPRIFHNSVGDPKVKDWASQLQRAFMFIAIAFAILLVQGIILELAAVNYIQGWMGPRSQRASDELDTIKQLHTLVNPHARGVSMMGKIFERLVLPSDDRDLYYQISHGRGDAEIWKQYADRLWNSVSQGNGQTSVLRQIDLIQQLERMGRDGALGQMLFTQLDASCDGEVTMEEVENLVHRVGVQLNMRAKAQGGIKSLLRKLEILLSIVVLGLIIFLYVQIFQSKYSANVGMLWTGLTGLSFAFGGVLLEFTQACTFVFAKHPYDVGDYIETKTKKLVVEKIFITHTNFEEVTNPEERGAVVQMSHASLLTEPIVNWTRTLEAVLEKKAIKTKEDETREKEKREQEDQVKEEARQLILLKTASLKHKLE